MRLIYNLVAESACPSSCMDTDIMEEMHMYPISATVMLYSEE